MNKMQTNIMWLYRSKELWFLEKCLPELGIHSVLPVLAKVVDQQVSILQGYFCSNKE
jgi:hypothetical protein